VAQAWHVAGEGAAEASRRQGRAATVSIKAGTVTLQRPKSAPNRGEPPTLILGLVEVREAAAPKGAGKPILWRLLTTLPVATLAEAEDVADLSPALAHRGGAPHHEA
jgi:hypothetical protein